MSFTVQSAFARKQTDDLKGQVREFWDQQPCGEIYASGFSELEQFERQAQIRYELEPYLAEFARFSDGAGKDVLEVGVGMGADHLEWARSGPRSLTGVDLTQRAAEFTRRRLQLHGLHSEVSVADAESLPYQDNSFDLVYSWGVLHHSPDTAQAIAEVRRVLRPGAAARIMIYHTKSVVGYMLWLRYGLLAGRPTRRIRDLFCQHLESPGTKAYTLGQARQLFDGFSTAEIRTQLSFGDLLLGKAGQRHRGILLSFLKTVYPRWLIRRLFRHQGLYLLVNAIK
jgi:ubiquinone/menaquinone biosynthesis C-methylase UbiE